MMRSRWFLAACMLIGVTPGRADEAPGGASPSFLGDVAPILVRSCIGCHNARKAESRYNMTTFALLSKGGQQGADVTLIPNDPDGSRFVELIRHDGAPRMPWKLDPLPLDQVAKIERWVQAGARYDGASPDEDWVALLHKRTPAVVPERYPIAVPITAVAFSPDGARVATSGYHEINLWSVADGSLAGRIAGLPERVYDLAYSPDGRWLATAGGDPGQLGVAQLWKAEPDGRATPVKSLVETPDSVLAVAFSPDGKRVAAGGTDRAVRIWEVEADKPPVTIEDHADWVFAVAFSPDGHRLATASRDKTSKVFDVANKESLVTFPAHTEGVVGVAFAPDGKAVTTAGADALRVWNPDEDGKPIRNLDGLGGPALRIRPSPDGKDLIAGSADRAVHVFRDGKQRLSLAGHGDWVYALAVSLDGKSLATGSWDGEVRLWNLEDGKPIRTILAAPGLARREADPPR